MGENSQARKILKRSNSIDISVDVQSLRRAYAQLFKLPDKCFEGVYSLPYLCLLNF